MWELGVKFQVANTLADIKNAPSSINHKRNANFSFIGIQTPNIFCAAFSTFSTGIYEFCLMTNTNINLKNEDKIINISPFNGEKRNELRLWEEWFWHRHLGKIRKLHNNCDLDQLWFRTVVIRWVVGKPNGKIKI